MNRFDYAQAHDGAEAVRLGEELTDAWGSWAPTLSPDCEQVAFVSDRTGSPRLFVQDLRPGQEPPEARLVALSMVKVDIAPVLARAA